MILCLANLVLKEITIFLTTNLVLLRILYRLQVLTKIQNDCIQNSEVIKIQSDFLNEKRF